MGYEEQLIMQANMAKKQQHSGIAENMAEGVVEVGFEVADSLIDVAADGEAVVDAVTDVADAADGIVDVAIDGADSAADGIVEGLLDGADDLPGLVIVGIIAGVIAVIGGIAFVVKRIVRGGR